MEQKLTLYPDTFLWRKGDEGLLYNVENGNKYHFRVTPCLGALCGKLEDLDSLYSALFTAELLDETTRMFVNAVSDQRFGCISAKNSPNISLPPFLNIQHDIERLRNDRDRGIGENVLKYLSTLTIYLGGNCKNKPYYKQIIYPVCSDETLNSDAIARFLDAIWIPSLHTINIVVSDSTDPVLVSMGQRLVSYKQQVVFYFVHSDLKNEITAPYILVNSGYKVRFICETCHDGLIPRMFKNRISRELEIQLIGYDFIIRTDQEYELWNQVVEDYDIESYAMISVYDNNSEFFERNVFLSESDLVENHLSRREVFAHQAINTEAFGKLTVMPDGRIFSDVTSPALGTIDDSIYEIIVQELEHNYSWRKVRSSDTCKQCIYQWLCPSPTPYEREAQKETACNFK